MFTNSGKDAIRRALEFLKAEKHHTVGIVTTSGNTYVSKCVTETISEYCKWEMYDNSKDLNFLFVVHEFGSIKSEESMKELRILGIPIINDFAYSFLSLYMNKRKDFAGEINLTSFPKSFNINFGGAIHLPNQIIGNSHLNIQASILEKLGTDLNIEAVEENIRIRKENREYYKSKLLMHGYKVVWDMEEICPGVCMISPLKPINLQDLKTFLQRNGIESSVFYGKEILFVPVHNFMSPHELDYVCYMMGAFGNEN